jgi:hypothetical protein
MIDFTNKIHIEKTVFYSSKNIMIYRSDNGITFQNTEKKIDIPLKNNYTVYAEEYKNKTLIISGNSGILVDENGKYENIDFKNIVPISKPVIIDDKLLFVSSMGNLCHFVVYDLIKRKRILQTQSIEFSSIYSDISKNDFYLLVNNSNLICYDINGQIKWKKFDKTKIANGIKYYKGNLIYYAGNQIKIINGENTQTIDIPDIKIDEISVLYNDSLFALCNDKKNICCIDLLSGYLKYEIKTLKPIKNIILTSMNIDNINRKILCFNNDTHIGIIELSVVKTTIYDPIEKIRDIMANKELIINTYKGDSYILKDNQNENSILEL